MTKQPNPLTDATAAADSSLSKSPNVAEDEAGAARALDPPDTAEPSRERTDAVPTIQPDATHATTATTASAAPTPRNTSAANHRPRRPFSTGTPGAVHRDRLAGAPAAAALLGAVALSIYLAVAPPHDGLERVAALARADVAAGRWDDALLRYQHLMALRPADAEYAVAAARVLDQLGQRPTGLRLLQHVAPVDVYPGSAVPPAKDLRSLSPLTPSAKAVRPPTDATQAPPPPGPTPPAGSAPPADPAAPAQPAAGVGPAHLLAARWMIEARVLGGSDDAPSLSHAREHLRQAENDPASRAEARRMLQLVDAFATPQPPATPTVLAPPPPTQPPPTQPPPTRPPVPAGDRR